MKLQQEYQQLCEKYITEFKRWMEITDNHFYVGNEAGGIVYTCDMYIDFDDLRRVVDERIDPDVFFNWYEYGEMCAHQDVPPISLKIWTKLTDTGRNNLLMALRNDN